MNTLVSRRRALRGTGRGLAGSDLSLARLFATCTSLTRGEPDRDAWPHGPARTGPAPGNLLIAGPGLCWEER